MANIVGTNSGDRIGPGTTPLGSTDGNDYIHGEGGGDLIFAGDGDDVVVGGAGSDTLSGGNGNDLLLGGETTDIFFSDAGSDTLSGGEGLDIAFYFGTEGVDFSVQEVTRTFVLNGVPTEVSGTEIVALDGSGDVDFLTSVELIIFVPLPDPDAIITEGDYAFVQADSSVTLNVLDNDRLETGDYGEGLTVTGISDLQIDLDGDGVNDLDLIPDNQPLSYYENGGLLNDGSILTVAADGTITWDPNGIYDTPPGEGETGPSITFVYEVQNANGDVQYGDVALKVTYPVPQGDITFETMEGFYSDFVASLLGLHIYQDGPDNSFLVSQLTSQTNFFEERDPAGATIGYDYDGDGDAEFRVWTEADGTTHELSFTRADRTDFALGGMKITGLDDGELAQIFFANGSGGGIGQVTFDNTALDENGLLEIANPGLAGQVSVIGIGASDFYVDDIYTV